MTTTPNRDLLIRMLETQAEMRAMFKQFGTETKVGSIDSRVSVLELDAAS